MPGLWKAACGARKDAATHLPWNPSRGISSHRPPIDIKWEKALLILQSVCEDETVYVKVLV